MKCIARLMVFALVAAVLVQCVSAEDPGYVFVTKWGTEGSGDGEFYYPRDVAVDTVGNVYVVDSNNDRIQVFDANGTFLKKWGTNGPGDGEFDHPWGIEVDGDGYVYVADTYNDRIQIFDVNGTFLRKWGSEGTGDGQFDRLNDVAVGTGGDVYVVDMDNHRIQKFDPNGAFLTTWGSRGSGDGKFFYPFGIAVDMTGNVYVADSDNNRIQKFDADGTFLSTFGSYGTGDGQFNHPRGIAVDMTGKIYVVDADNDRIQVFSADGSFLTKWGSSGSGDGQFENPRGIAIDDSGNVYVIDISGNRIQKFAPHLPPVADAGGDQLVPAGWAVTFDASNSSDPNMNIVTYEWWFSEGGNATGPITTRIYSAPGTYYATLTVTDETDLSDTDTVRIDVLPLETDSPMKATEQLIADIEALDLPTGTERKVVTKLEEVLRYLAHANEKLAAASAELEGEAPDDLLERMSEIMESITGDSGDLPTLFVTRTSPQVAAAPVTPDTGSTPDETAPAGSPDEPVTDDDAKEKKDKKDHPVKPDT